MATPLDLSTVTDAAQVFKHPLLNVKHFQRQLNATLDEKNHRLRTLVGGSYRQLLSTAELIVDLRHEIERVEADLAGVADRCGRKAVATKVTALAQVEPHDVHPNNGMAAGWGTSQLARMRALDGCVLAVGRLLKGKEGGATRGARLITASMVWVLSRLLIHGLANELKQLHAPEETKQVLEDTRQKLLRLQGRLRRGVRKMIERDDDDDDRQELVSALCAYSLATSSGLREVVRWFLDVRGQSIVLAFEAEDESPKERVLKALRLYTKALQDVQMMVPRKLSDALLSLKSKQLLKNKQLRELEGLRLDVCERWFGDDITFFTPFIRHDDLDQQQGIDMLQSWAKNASKVLLEGLRNALQLTTDLNAVKELRTLVLEKWIEDSRKIKGSDTAVLLDGLRQACLDRMVELVEQRSAKLHLVSSEVEGSLANWQTGVTDQTHSIWATDMLNTDIADGAGLFRQEILARMHGRNESVSRALNSYLTWRRLVGEVTAIIGQMRSQKWDDDLEDLEDELGLDRRDELLSKDDPATVQEHLDASLVAAFNALHEKLSSLLDGHAANEHFGAMSIFVLRVIRDIRSDLPAQPDLVPFGLDLVPAIHRTLAATVAAAPLDAFDAAAFRRTKAVGRALWEGAPPLPSQPSPAAFKLLRALTAGMTRVGSDLWSRAAVRALKQHVLAEVVRRWREALDVGSDEPEEDKESAEDKEDAADKEDAEPEEEKQKESNGAINGDGAKHAQRDVLIQAVFDALLLQHCLALSASAAAGAEVVDLEEVVTVLHDRLKLEDTLRQRLSKDALEYWKKISLLFGLLA